MVTSKLSGSATIDPARVPGSATATAAPLPETAIAIEADWQLATLRDGLVALVVALTEQLTTAVADQAEQLGRVTADRDALECRVRELEAQPAESLKQSTSATRTAPGTVRHAPWWQFWRRSSGDVTK